jgi:benzaldehyde dehydrogenase (NAD)
LSRNGPFFEPTVITGVTPGMAALDEERFGPIAVISTFRTDEDAITLANATEYGLVAAVVSNDLARDQRMADGLRSGVAHINDQTVVHGVYGPIGGVGASGKHTALAVPPPALVLNKHPPTSPGSNKRLVASCEEATWNP